ncbi:MAG TPA: iron-containing alcohol dehydrogenase [Chloroflexota bacterium]
MITLYASPSILFGPDALAACGEQARRLGATRAFLVTTPGMPQRPAFAAVLESLRAASVEVAALAQIPPEPGVAELERALAIGAGVSYDVVVGMGGGSAMDAAKLIAMLHANPGPVDRYFGIGRVPLPGLPTVMIPTTAGSGSEVSQDAVLTDRAAGTKRAVKDPKVIPACTIVDPRATVTCSPALTARSGLDALTHAIEAFTARRANPITDMYAWQAIVLIQQHITDAVKSGDDPAARLGMALGSLLAGQAFTNTGTAAVHACGYPLSGLYGIPHGTANALMLPHIVAFNMETSRKYDRLLSVFSTGDLPASLRTLIQEVGLPIRLRDVGVERADLTRMAAIAATDDRHLSANPRTMDVADLEAVFELAW